jgi:hypothetical protein
MKNEHPKLPGNTRCRLSHKKCTRVHQAETLSRLAIHFVKTAIKRTE